MCSSGPWNPLTEASSKGSIEDVDRLLKQKADPNQRSENGATPLVCASRNGHVDVVQRLLDGKADASKCASHTAYPLVSACRKGHTEVVRKLLDHKVDVNLHGECRETPLTWASRNGYDEIVQQLLAHNADMGLTNGEHDTPLICASTYGHIHVVDRLLNHKANINALNSYYGGSALCCAIHEGHVNIVNKLLECKANVNVESEDAAGFIISPLRIALHKHHVDIALILLAQKADVSGEALEYACSLGNIDLIQTLLRYKPNVDEKILSSMVWNASCYGHVDVVEMLLMHNAETRWVLTRASGRGWVDIVQLLLHAGCQEACDPKLMEEAIDAAVRDNHQFVESMLREWKVPPRSESDVTDHGLTPASSAKNSGHCAIPLNSTGSSSLGAKVSDDDFLLIGDADACPYTWEEEAIDLGVVAISTV